MNIDPQQQIRKWLAEELASGIAKNPAYSLRALAKKVKISSPALSEILSNKRSLSERRALELVQFLAAPEEKIKILEVAFASSNQLKKLKQHESLYSEEILPQEMSDFLTDWRYFAVMSLMRATSLKEQDASSVIYKKLNIPANTSKTIVDRLLENGLIAVQGTYFQVTNKVFRSPEDFPSQLINERIADGLANARAAMDNEQKWHKCIFSTITTDLTRLDEATGMIEDFVKRLSVFLSSGRGTEVFELSVNLFSLTNLDHLPPSKNDDN